MWVLKCGVSITHALLRSVNSELQTRVIWSKVFMFTGVVEAILLTPEICSWETSPLPADWEGTRDIILQSLLPAQSFHSWQFSVQMHILLHRGEMPFLLSFRHFSRVFHITHLASNTICVSCKVIIMLNCQLCLGFRTRLCTRPRELPCACLRLYVANIFKMISSWEPQDSLSIFVLFRSQLWTCFSTRLCLLTPRFL